MCCTLTSKLGYRLVKGGNQKYTRATRKGLFSNPRLLENEKKERKVGVMKHSHTHVGNFYLVC